MGSREAGRVATGGKGSREPEIGRDRRGGGGRDH